MIGGGGGGTLIVLTGGPVGGSGGNAAAFAGGHGTGSGTKSPDTGCLGCGKSFVLGLAFAPTNSTVLALAAAVALTCRASAAFGSSPVFGGMEEIERDNDHKLDFASQDEIAFEP